ncbi:MAG: hypothetical protein AAF184_20325 [Pseudomonadota bacterium]
MAIAEEQGPDVSAPAATLPSQVLLAPPAQDAPIDVFLDFALTGVNNLDSVAGTFDPGGFARSRSGNRG